MKVYLIVIEHYDEYIAGPECVFLNGEDAAKFADEWNDAFQEGHADVQEEEVYQSLDEALAEDEYGAHFAEMRGEYAEEAE